MGRTRPSNNYGQQRGIFKDELLRLLEDYPDDILITVNMAGNLLLAVPGEEGEFLYEGYINMADQKRHGPGHYKGEHVQW